MEKNIKPITPISAMQKINFTEEHANRMYILLLDMLLKNKTVSTKFGTTLNVVELLHTTTINTLNSIRLNIAKQIENLENQDEWVSTDSTQASLENLKNVKETVNLIIGYRRKLAEKEEIERERASLKASIEKIKEETKTPEDRIKEAESRLEELDKE